MNKIGITQLIKLYLFSKYLSFSTVILLLYISDSPLFLTLFRWAVLGTLGVKFVTMMKLMRSVDVVKDNLEGISNRY